MNSRIPIRIGRIVRDLAAVGTLVLFACSGPVSSVRYVTESQNMQSDMIYALVSSGWQIEYQDMETGEIKAKKNLLGDHFAGKPDTPAFASVRFKDGTVLLDVYQPGLAYFGHSTPRTDFLRDQLVAAYKQKYRGLR